MMNFRGLKDGHVIFDISSIECIEVLDLQKGEWIIRVHLKGADGCTVRSYDIYDGNEQDVKASFEKLIEQIPGVTIV